MSAAEFGFLAVGALVGFFIASVFAGVKFDELWSEARDLRTEMRMLEEALTDAQEGRHPRVWDEPSGVNVIADVKREALDRRRFVEEYPDVPVLDLTEAENDE